MSIAIRPFAPRDQVSLRQAIDAVCGERRWMSTQRFEPTPDWTHAFEVPACLCHRLLLAEDEGQVVGWCRLFPLNGCGSPNGEGQVGIGILREHRGHGLGKALLEQVIHWAAHRQLQRATLQTRVSNARAIHLFQQCGFVQKDHPKDGWLDMECRF